MQDLESTNHLQLAEASCTSKAEFSLSSIARMSAALSTDFQHCHTLSV
jgi:hypothetical protein